MTQSNISESLNSLFQNLENKDFLNYFPPSYLYDDHGAKHYTKVHDLDIYYPFHSEIQVAEKYAQTITQQLGPKVLFFEYCCGLCKKSKPFLRKFEDLTGFVGVDINAKVLEEAKSSLKEEFPNLNVHTVADDILTENLNLPKNFEDHKKKLHFFASSNINMFSKKDIVAFFKHVSKNMGSEDLFLVTIDSVKDVKLTEKVYSSDFFERHVKNLFTILN